jgi:hypothetical protein
VSIDRCVEATLVPGNGLFHRRGQVLPQVEPVGDLHRLRCGGPGRLRVGGGPISADHRCSGVFLQPGCQRFGIPADQYVYDPVVLAVDQHGAVVMATLDREVIDSKHGDATDGRIWQGTDQAKETITAGRHAQRCGKPGTRPAGQREPDRRQHPPKPFAARDQRRVSPSTCSTKVLRRQSGLSQKNRRTVSEIRTRRPATGASVNVRP